MEGLLRKFVDSPLLAAVAALRRWAFVNTRIPPMALEYYVQGWLRAMVGVAACFLASRFSSAGLFVGGLFFLWIGGVYALSLVAAKSVSRSWCDEVWRREILDSASRREDDLTQRLSALAMIGISLVLLLLFVIIRDPMGLAVAFGMTGLAFAETSRCYIRAADPPSPALAAR
jgi:ABC-type phosphate transport system permease subunit